MEVIKEISPKYISENLEWYTYTHEFRFYPIFITKWELFDELCQLLFPVLFRLYLEIGNFSEIDNSRFQIQRYPV